jgi:hypothetical protein
MWTKEAELMIPLTPTGNPQPPQVKDKDTAPESAVG